jgi:hypothetical protein
MNDVQKRVSAMNPVPIEDVKEAARTPEALALLRRVLDEPIATPPLSPSHRWRTGAPRRVTRLRLRLPVVAGVSAIILAGTAIGWALTNSARDTVSVQCQIAGSDTVIPATTGNPVEDCAAQWRRDTGTNPPPLVAYDNGHGGILVAPADQPPLPGATPLPTGATQNVSMIEVQQSLDDLVGGLDSGCYDNATAVTMTTQILARFGMADWTVRPAPSTDFSPPSTSSVAPASNQCVDTAILDPTTSTVMLRALGSPASPDAPYEKLAAKLRSIAQGCLSLDATAQQVRTAASELGLSETANQYQVTEVQVKDAGCTTIDENVGGTIFLILRGPAS